MPVIMGAIYDVRFVAPADVWKSDEVITDPAEWAMYAAALKERPGDCLTGKRTVLVRRRVR